MRIATIVVVAGVVLGTIITFLVRPDRTPNALDFVLPLIACTAMFFQKRYPVAVLIVVTLCTLAYYPYARMDGPMMALPVMALYSAAAQGYLLAAITTGATALLLMGLGELGGTRHVSNTGFIMIAEGMVATIAAGGVTRSWRAYRQEVDRRIAQEAQRGEAEERLRIARELHDVIGHNISMINVQAGSALHGFKKRPEEAEEALRTIKDTSKETLRQLRSTLGMLRQVDEDAPIAPAASLARLDELTRASGLRVVTRVTGSLHDLPAEVDLAAARIVKEALTNVVRHSGGDSATMTVTRDPDLLTVRVEDDGPGASFTDGTGFGLQGMRERAAALGGSLVAGPRTPSGFHVIAELPLKGTA
ncbi:sensor histidine kinase [Nonomuraea soli]|uniref:histidine kinase n=1 Tax=Nonomuraea soli TaxID=1032476 RepID=A0A7W0HU32_9ACTN|nr:sensor histidine kinase [Nonomuraea soli]MBA2895346.1 signal transduction histidine kinase [Nonomuraea soli]